MKLQLKHSFDAAHRLEFHQGKCFNLHGHRWEVLIEIESNIENDMIFDFGDLKKVINEFDHSTILKACDENKELIDILVKMKMNLVLLLI